MSLPIKRLRKNLLLDIERLRSTIGLPIRSLDRMKRNAMIGRQPTIMKLTQELQKYEIIYDEAIIKSNERRKKWSLYL